MQQGLNNVVLCKFFQRGRCNRGINCRFRHEFRHNSVAVQSHTLGPDAVSTLGELQASAPLEDVLRFFQGMPDLAMSSRMTTGLLEIS